MSYFLLDEKLEMGYPVGRDVESVLKARTEMSDIDLTVGAGKLSGEKRFHTTVILHTRQIKKS